MIRWSEKVTNENRIFNGNRECFQRQCMCLYKTQLNHKGTKNSEKNSFTPLTFRYRSKGVVRGIRGKERFSVKKKSAFCKKNREKCKRRKKAPFRGSSAQERFGASIFSYAEEVVAVEYKGSTPSALSRTIL
ncbi:hypothetical protein TNIN_422001 [Trichonephila inaurata madagascariensis]|uniref:Uncharacterized protein n=1 Tax=Trichonephila inaurata madagascariensis TaxID=2747483 RepID=A0A8X6YTZ4_9ARAC|nr:hypothetical protein TNIN_422001 [Trichonephila inaurata madagascariensis]